MEHLVVGRVCWMSRRHGPRVWGGRVSLSAMLVSITCVTLSFLPSQSISPACGSSRCAVIVLSCGEFRQRLIV